MTPYSYIKKEIITGKLNPGTIFNEDAYLKLEMIVLRLIPA